MRCHLSVPARPQPAGRLERGPEAGSFDPSTATHLAPSPALDVDEPVTPAARPWCRSSRTVRPSEGRRKLGAESAARSRARRCGSSATGVCPSGPAGARSPGAGGRDPGCRRPGRDRGGDVGCGTGGLAAGDRRRGAGGPWGTFVEGATPVLSPAVARKLAGRPARSGAYHGRGGALPHRARTPTDPVLGDHRCRRPDRPHHPPASLAKGGEGPNEGDSPPVRRNSQIAGGGSEGKSTIACSVSAAQTPL